MTDSQSLARLQQELQQRNVPAEIVNRPYPCLELKMGCHSIRVEATEAVRGRELFEWTDEIDAIHRTSFADTVAQLWHLAVGYAQGEKTTAKEE
jgi:hypothetical protein